MTDPFIGEVRLMSYTVVPRGWAPCNGQLLPINQNQALFSLLGTTYGGDGRTTFALPDLRGRVPMHAGNGYNPGQTGGALQHTLIISELPQHWHPLMGSGANATANDPTGRVLGVTKDKAYSNAPSAPLHPEAVKRTGAGQAHDNVQPTLAIQFCIALQGIYPSRG